jgi:uncharacterized protein YdhG (YjbR/CyaY superfamily)
MSTQTRKNESGEFSDAEKAAMKERAKELKAEAKASKNKAEGERLALAAIAAMQGTDRAMAEKLHEIIRTNVPGLSAKTWYGMPAYANAEGHVICFFQSAQKFSARYATLGFSDKANLDDASMWPTSFALTELTPAGESHILALLQKAVA